MWTNTLSIETAGGAAQPSDPGELCSADGQSIQQHAAPCPAAWSQTARHAEQLLTDHRSEQSRLFKTSHSRFLVEENMAGWLKSK